jgi:class 3 adenylate cyclase/tetratricopeptide (TPR) repeat protein
LFGDLVGFTTLSESRDPDDVRELLSRYFATARTVIERYGGTVEKFIGDAVMAVWGVPVSHEDDAERAVRAGLDLVDAVVSLGETVGAAGLSMRVGVVTGEVAVNVGVTGEGMVAGDAVNTASRVQSAAAPNKVWVDDATRGLTVAAVSYEDRGEHELKGKAEPRRLFEARQVVAAVGGARRVDGLEAPLSGRDRELRLVKELFHGTLEEGRPRLVAVFGAAGVGKSRIGWEFEKYYDGINTDVMGHDGRCLSYGDGVAFWALAEIVRGRMRMLEGDANDVVVERLKEGLEHYVPTVDDRAWLLPRLATLLGVVEIVAPGASFTREDLFAAWRTFLEHVSRADGAVGAVLRIDDLQWADPGLLDFITHVLDNAQAPIFILTLARSDLLDHVPGFGNGRRATTVYLEPLSDASMATLVDGLVGGLPEQVRDVLVKRSEGIPLFAVETVRALIDRDAVIPSEGRYVLAADATERVDLADLSLPTSLHTLIASRLDGLPPEQRRVVQHASVLGQSFTQVGLLALLAAVDDQVDVDAALAGLVRKEIFSIETESRSPERGQYRFVQAMVRTVAYDSLSRRDRKSRHLAAADFLANEPDADSIPAVLASHFLDAYAAAGQDPDAADIGARAVELLERAAEHARDLGAPAEARRHLETALGLVSEPVATGRLTAAAARAALTSGAVIDAVQLAESARRAFESAGADVDAARALALWGEAQIAAGIGHEVVEPLAAAYAKLEGRPGAEAVAAQCALAVARAHYLSIGDSLASIPWFERAVILGEALEDIPLLSSTLASYSGALVLVGRSRMGLGLLRVSLELARELGDPSSQLKPLNNLVSFLATRDLSAAVDYAEQGLAVVRRAGDREWGLTLVGSAAHVYWNAGAWDEALALMDDLDYESDHGPILVLLAAYAASIRAARGLPLAVPEIRDLPIGMRTDVVLTAARGLVASFGARATGDFATAARVSEAALVEYGTTSGVDDDFPIFWVTAMGDQLEIGNLAGAQRLCAIVADTPRGHVPMLVRALLPWFQARVNALAGNDDAVDALFAVAATALREFGAEFYLARALLDHAEWLSSVGRTADAPPLVEEALEKFTRLQAGPWLERARRLIDGTVPSAQEADAISS